MTISYSAPAKIILSGEHAVIYGKPGFTSALNQRLTFSITHTQKSGLNRDKTIVAISQIVKEYLKKKKIRYVDKSYVVKIDSKIPSGRNLGSSAALSVASAAAFLHLYTNKAPKREIINEVAYEIEKLFHGNPSGLDTTTSCFGGTIYYRKEFEFLKHMAKLDIRIPHHFQKRLIIIDSGKSIESTKTMIESVRQRYEKDTVGTELVLNTIEKITKRMVLAVKEENEEEFERAIRENEVALEQLGVVSESTKELLDSLQRFGVGKVTGGGGIKKGSGNIVFFANRVKEIQLHLQARDIPFFIFAQDFEGIIQL